MSKKAICVGINNYPGTHNDLNGCVNDMNDWSNLLADQFDYDVSQISDAGATADAILTALAKLVEEAEAGDCLAFTFSGHGTYVLDGADADESDNYDEAICATDRNILDDEIRHILHNLDPGAFLTVISDSCHSESVSRRLIDKNREKDALSVPEYPVLARYMPMRNHKRFDTIRVPMRHRSFGSGAIMNHLLLSGCTAVEYSYDAWINGKFNGAMSANTIALIRDNPGINYSDLHGKLRVRLPSRHYPQTPQLEGPDALRNRSVFC